MIANVGLLAAITTFLIIAWLTDELSYLAPYKTALFQLHAEQLGVATLILFMNLCAVYYGVARHLFLRDTGRKLQHVDRQLGTADTILDDLRQEIEP